VTATAVEATWDQAWVTALADLELEVDRAEALLRSAEVDPPEVSAWAPPVGLGPLPESLLDRAKALHARQIKVSSAIVEALTQNRVQAAVAARMETGRVASRPVYVDSAC
jgi:hypothetical protein